MSSAQALRIVKSQQLAQYARLEKFKQKLVKEETLMPIWIKFVHEMTEKLQYQIPELLRPPVTGMNTALFSEWKLRIEMMIQRLIDSGLTWNGSDPAHSIGHVIRDLVNTALIVFLGKYPYRQLYIGGMAGVFHDFSTAIVKRYDEDHRALRHGTATALLLHEFTRDLFTGENEGFDFDCMLLAIAGHTNEFATEKLKDRKPKKVEKSKFSIPVWPDFDAKGIPHLFMHLPRQIDRLENCGATHFARHYLTLVEEHKDMAYGEMVIVNYERWMRVKLRSRDLLESYRKETTILEHIRMYADTQTNTSPYAQWDFGFYCILRDAHRKRAYRIMNAPQRLNIPRNVSFEEIVEVFHFHFLPTVIEPTTLGRSSAYTLYAAFQKLPRVDKEAFACVFLQCMIEYVDWYDTVNSIVTNQMPKNAMQFLSLQNIIGKANIMDVLKPTPRMEELIEKFNFITT